MMVKKINPFVLIYFIVAFASHAAEKNMRVVSHYSRSLQREQKMMVYIPSTGEKHSVLYLLHGAAGDYTNWNEKTTLNTIADGFNLIIVMPDGGPFSWYSDSPLVASSQYETYLIKELIPFVDSVFDTYREKEGRGICGLSMGGYGALKYGLKYPHYFASASSMSGVLDILAYPDKWQMRTIFGRQEDSIDTWKKNDLASFLPIRDDTLAIKFDIGIDDFALQDNRNFTAFLQKYKIAFEYAEYPGRHSWNYWGLHLFEHLQFHRRHLRPK